MYRLIGQIALFPYDFAPAGWRFCDGSVLPIGEYGALFNLLENTFGGDIGQGTFALPDFRVSTPRGCNYCISLVGSFGGVYEGAMLGETLVSVTPDSVKVPNLVECAGQSLPIAQYLPLQTYLGTRFGNQGKDKVVLPDLRGKAPAKSRYVMAAQGDVPDGGKRDAYVGEIILLPFDLSSHLGNKFRLCNGELLQIKPNAALFSSLRNRFGGDGNQTFALPKLPAPPNFNYYISLGGTLAPKS